MNLTTQTKKTSRAPAHRRWLQKPPSDIEEQNKLANELIKWVSDVVYELEDFPISKSMAPTRFYAIAKDNEYFAEALDLARYVISSRLQKGLREKSIDKDYVMRMLPIYNQDFRSYMLAKIKQSEEAKGNKPFTVMLNCFKCPVNPEENNNDDYRKN